MQINGGLKSYCVHEYLNKICFKTVPIVFDIDYQIAEINVQSSTDYGQKLNVIYFHTIELNILFE